MTVNLVRDRLRSYWSMTKSLQTALLIVTGLAGFASGRCPVMTWQMSVAVALTLMLAVSGSTVLNMVYDRDIDKLMTRTCWRPLPTGRVSVPESVILGIGLTCLGVIWALRVDALYGLIVLSGVLLDVLVYTMWLKRRTAFAIIIGGMAGGMPVLAGRALAIGYVDGIGLLLALSVLLWIPTHIMTFSIRYQADYERAGIPTFPSVYGVHTTRVLISVFSIGAGVTIGLAAVLVGVAWGPRMILGILSMGLLALAIGNVLRPSAKLNFSLFKYASLYMLISMGVFLSMAL